MIPRERSRSVHGLIQWARGMCTDEVPYAEIDKVLGRAVDAAKNLEGQRAAIRKDFDTLDGQWHHLHREYRAVRAELEAVKNERDLAVPTLAAFTPADKPNQGADAMSITAIGFESREQANGKIAWDIYLDDEHHGGGTSEVSHVAALTAAANYLRDRATSEAGAALSATERPKMVDVEGTILRELALPGIKQADIVQSYAFGLDSDEQINWARINDAIIHKWSVSGLGNIKAKAWAKWEGR